MKDVNSSQDYHVFSQWATDHKTENPFTATGLVLGRKPNQDKKAPNPSNSGIFGVHQFNNFDCFFLYCPKKVTKGLSKIFTKKTLMSWGIRSLA